MTSRFLSGSVAIALSVSGAGLLNACGGDEAASADSWCAFVIEADAASAVFDDLSADTAEAEADIRLVESFAQRMPSEAPSEIADDAQLFSDVTQTLVDAFVAADFSILDVDMAFMTEDLEARFEVAGGNLNTYTMRECDRPFGTDETDADTATPADDPDTDPDPASIEPDADPVDEFEAGGDFDPTNGTIRDQMIAQFQAIGLTADEARCLADNLDFNDPEVQSGDIGAMLAVFGECDIDIDRLTELGG